MKVFSKNLFIALILATGLILLSACVTGPVAKPGLYVNKEYRYTVKYPTNFLTQPPMTKNEVFRAATAGGLPVVVSAIFDKMKFEDVPDHQVKLLKTFGGSNIKILSKKHTRLTDGTPAHEIVVSWDHPQIKGLNTMTLRVIKGNKMIGVGITGVGKISEDLKKISYSLTFY